MIHQPKGLAHVGIPCRDYQKSLAFYRQLGFVDMNMSTDCCFIRLGDCIVELYQRKDDLAQKEVGVIDHLALRCEDIDACYAEAVSLGWQIITDGIESNTMAAPKSNRYFLFLGPDGEKLEFAELSGLAPTGEFLFWLPKRGTRKTRQGRSLAYPHAPVGVENKGCAHGGVEVGRADKRRRHTGASFLRGSFCKETLRTDDPLGTPLALVLEQFFTNIERSIKNGRLVHDRSNRREQLLYQRI